MPNNIFHQRIAKSFTSINELNKTPPTQFALQSWQVVPHFILVRSKFEVGCSEPVQLQLQTTQLRKDEHITPKQTCMFCKMSSETWHVCIGSISCVNSYLLPN